jgi:probable F420-dependent oxidoreductase
MEFGVNLPIFGEDPDPVIETAVLAENLGFETVWMGDHIVQPIEVKSVYPYSSHSQRGIGETPAYMDVFVGMTAVAMRTSRIRIGTSVLIVPYRNPLHTAKLLATVDVFSKGRLDVGIGIGWQAEEFEALGVPFRDRGPRSDEYLRIYRKLWTEEPVSYEGRFFRFDELSFRPKPIQPLGPPIWVGGNSDAALKRVAALGDYWQPVNLNFDQLASAQERLREICAVNGRQYESIRLGLNRGVLLTAEDRDLRPFDPERPFAPFIGSPRQFVHECRRYADMGVVHIHCHFVARDQEGRHSMMRRFAEEVKPRVDA